MLNPDQMNMVPAFHTVQTAYAAVSGAQASPPAQQVMGIALLFSELCRTLRLDPSEMLDKARRMARHAEDHRSLELRALRDYLNKELDQ